MVHISPSPKVLIKALYCQHLVNIKIIIYAIITFQTLPTCSDLHGAWFSNYTKTLKRRKMVSCSCTAAAGAGSAQAWVPRPVLVLSPGGRSRHGLSSWSRLHFGCSVLPGAWKRGDYTYRETLMLSLPAQKHTSQCSGHGLPGWKGRVSQLGLQQAAAQICQGLFLGTEMCVIMS